MMQLDAKSLTKQDVIASPIIMTTEDRDGFKIAERMSIISAQCAFDASVFNTIFATVQPSEGRRQTAVEQTMQEGVDTVLFELKKQALQLNADAVLGIRIHYTPIGYGASNMTLISGIGTAVTFEA